MTNMLKILLTITLFISVNSFASNKEFLPKSFSAVFKQSYRSSLSGTIKSSRGKIDYKYPGNIRFETKKPDNIVFVSNKKKTWYYTAPFIKGEKGELSVSSAKKNVLSRFFDVLKNGLKTNELYSVKKTKKGYLVSFSKKAKKDVGVQKALLVFKSKAPDFLSIKNIELTYVDKKKVKLTLSKIKTNYKFNKRHFYFKAPKNTKTTHR